MFPIIPVESQYGESTESQGTKRKFWFRDTQGERILFKADDRGTGEDWAEKLACELCHLLGLPHAHYDLAYEKQIDKPRPGVICKTIVLPTQELVPGNQFLLDRNPRYPRDRKYQVREHTVDAVTSVLHSWNLPPQEFTQNLPGQIETALDVFIGYVMLDAWIANQDRHHENWAAICNGAGEPLLAPTFDHGASLARNLTDKERKERLTTRDQNRQMPAFARRAKSAFYGSPHETKPLSTLDAWQAFAQKHPNAKNAWLKRLCSISPETTETLLSQVPPQRMSETCREFTLQLLNENKRRLLAENTDD